MDLEAIRRFYAEEIEAVAGLRSQALVEAFARVPREQFLGPGPWQIMVPGAELTGGGYRTTRDADPRHVYHNVVVALDAARQINNGQPSGLASWLEALDLRPGDRAVHIGCGAGYYTAIVAEVVGPEGHVTGVEIDPDLASRARRNLAGRDNVDLVEADGATHAPEPSDAIFINAGATQPRAVWLDALRPGGRLVVPLTFSRTPDGIGSGFVLKVTREEEGYAARFLTPISIYPCLGARDETQNQRLRDGLARGTWGTVRSLRRDPHEPDGTCWLHGEGVCLSTASPS
jgi:protein-L-isoaspartate(D-aspartate) O-methyltransferase